MNRRIKSINCSLIATLLIAAAAPMMAHAGTMTIYNDNCTTLVWLTKRNWVKVHIDTIQPGGTNTWVTLNKGESKTVSVKSKYTAFGNTYTYYYTHEAKGTTGGDNDASGAKDTSVTCRKGVMGVCQCLLDGR